MGWVKDAMLKGRFEVPRQGQKDQADMPEYPRGSRYLNASWRCDMQRLEGSLWVYYFFIYR